ncbi:2-amino-4-hydroxy-6-hydroxymethyldihydropteridine diphosphokinase [Nesterenkonia flava]|uniref:Bifunctional folate synthesis protein n=1 Tax=Nesterenkonia flava TaxID=469799 RepID=A0ABU1FVA3_9MICC|nr:2-amino-4-hydroxy-6-hydroxymethyldihydropteridine diphosphokinase [Nesterenkonia flava]MDR5712192.1 2-amino-4-hydroxy-6-hydroxymethyldihydropteridine diphosphokinase [Nesterenkonia flava]
MSDLIRLTGLRMTGYHGVFDFEKTEGQPFVVDAELELDLTAAARTDNVIDTVSYADVADLIEDVVSKERFDLIETLADTIARAILFSDERIRATTITVHKPRAPLTQEFDDVSITVRRAREDLDPMLVTIGTGSVPRIMKQMEAEAAADNAAPTRDPDLPASFPVRAVLALGSNLGDSRATLASAVDALKAAEGVTLLNTSPLARTKPVGGPDNQRDYLNQVVEIETQLSPHELLNLVQRVEEEHNRVREERWGPRTLDVDIVTYAGAVIDSPRLQVPHPSAAERAFVLLPWSWMDPVALLDGTPVRELAVQAADHGDVERLE